MTTTQQVSATLDHRWIRAQFPALDLQQDGRPVVYLDNPAGTQVPERTIAAIAAYLRTANANVHGAFLTSERTDAMLGTVRRRWPISSARRRPVRSSWVPNMTTLTYLFSQAIGRDFAPGDEVIVTELDHDANVSPWLDLAERGVVIRRAPVRPEDCTLDMEALAGLLSPRTRLVAVTYASNAVGTVTDIAGDRPAGARGRRAGLGRRGALRPARPYRRAGAGRGLPGLFVLQVLRAAPGHALWPRRSAGAHHARTSCAPRRTPCPKSSRPAPKTTSAWPGWSARSTTWPSWAAGPPTAPRPTAEPRRTSLLRAHDRHSCL